MPDQTSATVIARALHEAGIRYMFGHPGGEVVEFMDALESQGIAFVLTGHESTATFMAGTVGRLTGIPGACLATLGPGACNLVLGVGSAYLDRDPLLAFSARTATGRIHRSNKQNLPLNDLFAPITKWSVALEGKGSAQTIEDAVYLSTAYPRGPVYFSIPADVTTGTEQANGPSPSPPASPDPNDRAFDNVVKALNTARKPVGVIGIAMDAEKDAPAVRRFFQETGIPYVDTCQAKGIADPNGPRFLGSVLPAAGDMPITEWLLESDCVLGVGFDPVESSKEWHFDVPLYAIANGPIGFGTFQPPVECTGDVSVLMDRLCEAYEGGNDWQDTAIQTLRQRVTDIIRPEATSTEKGLSPYHLIADLRHMLPEETIISGDVGAHKNILGQVWRAPQPNTFLMSNGLSSMGYGVSAAMAAALVRPDQPVVSITGDGAFAMMVQELETVRRMNIAPLFIVLCDASLAIIKFAQKLRDLPPSGVDFLPVDWAKIAEGFGVRGETATTTQEVQQSIASWLSSREPMVLAVALDESLYTGLRY